MAWTPAGRISVRETLARLYPRVADVERIVRDAGLDIGYIGYDAKPINQWNMVLGDAETRVGKLDALIAVALNENPDNDVLKAAAAGTPPPALAGPDPRNWQGPTGPQLEKILGAQSTLVPIGYLELGLRRARSVAKVIRADRAAGSGFLVRDSVLITNHHVLPDEATAATAQALFNYQQTAEGLAAEVDARALDPGAYFRTSEADDWSAVKVVGDANATWGAIDLIHASVNTGDRVNIIQHPLGQQKQISFYANTVAYVGAGRVQYLTDTEPGSSGSPVFDKDWRLVALHHSGGWLTEPNGPDPNRQFYRNEGILIDAAIGGLEA